MPGRAVAWVDRAARFPGRKRDMDRWTSLSRLRAHDGVRGIGPGGWVGLGEREFREKR
jgi:hypothetical protein